MWTNEALMELPLIYLVGVKICKLSPGFVDDLGLKSFFDRVTLPVAPTIFSRLLIVVAASVLF